MKQFNWYEKQIKSMKSQHLRAYSSVLPFLIPLAIQSDKYNKAFTEIGSFIETMMKNALTLIIAPVCGIILLIILIIHLVKLFGMYQDGRGGEMQPKIIQAIALVIGIGLCATAATWGWAMVS